MLIDLGWRSNDQWIRNTDDGIVSTRIIELIEHKAHSANSSSLLVIAFNHGPRSKRRVRTPEHRFLRHRVVVPPANRRQVCLRQFPLANRINLSNEEPSALLGSRNRKPKLDEMDAVARQQLFERRRLSDEGFVLIVCAKAEHALNACAVVPRPVEQHELASGGQAFDITLEVPLSTLALIRLLQGHRRCPSRIEMLGEALDRPAFACGVSPFEENHKALASVFDPILELQELDL